MFIICKNDFPFLVCPHETGFILARKIVEYYQKKCGQQLGLASPTHYHLHSVSVVTQMLIEQLKLEIENGINKTNHTETTEVKIGSKCQAPWCPICKGSGGSTGKGFQD